MKIYLQDKINRENYGRLYIDKELVVKLNDNLRSGNDEVIVFENGVKLYNIFEVKFINASDLNIIALHESEVDRSNFLNKYGCHIILFLLIFGITGWISIIMNFLNTSK